MHAAILLLASLAGQYDFWQQPDAPLPIVEQTVECVSVAHLDDGVELVFFWASVQGEWTCLDHRWLSSDMVLGQVDDAWLLQWKDAGENCYRVVRARCYVESWETESPLAEQNARPWFRQLLEPGLKQAPEVK